MINVGDTIEIYGKISATSPTGFTVALEEIYADLQWRKLNPAKSLDIATTDYNTSLTDQELALCKLLAGSKGASQVLSPDQQVLCASIVAKLTTP